MKVCLMQELDALTNKHDDGRKGRTEADQDIDLKTNAPKPAPVFVGTQVCPDPYCACLLSLRVLPMTSEDYFVWPHLPDASLNIHDATAATY